MGGEEKSSSTEERFRAWLAKLDRSTILGGLLTLLAVVVVVWLVQERIALQKETAALHAELHGDPGNSMQGNLAKLGYAGGGKESDSGNAEGSREAPSLEAPALDSATEVAQSPASEPVGNMTSAGNSCEDLGPSCSDWARQGECEANKDWMLGTVDKPGNCLKSCGKCSGDSAGVALAPESVLHGAASSSDTSACVDVNANCKTWALHGECSNNPEFMSGGEGYQGQCIQSCGKCAARPDTLIDVHAAWTETDAGVPNKLAANALNKLVGVRKLRWPQKKAASGRLCIGLSTSACQRGLYTPQGAELLDAANRSLVKGVGGPTGCAEAWTTSIVSDDQIAGVLTMIYTLRKFASEDRDIVVFVTRAVSQPYVQQLLDACLIVKQVTEPLDPKTHMGFVKLNLWLAVEYTKVAFVEYNSWIRADPSEIFAFQPPAAIKTAPHARLMNEMFGSYFFLLEPSRQTFYDMLAKVGNVDSAERVDNQTVYTERLFFSGYYDKWYIIPSHFLEFAQDVVSVIIPELTNTRIRRVVKSMPPYTPETVIDYSMLQAKGIFSNLHVKPWQPGWRIPCSWECRYRKYHQLYEAVAEEWWHHYYNLMDLPIPAQRSLYALAEEHDPSQLYSKKEYEHCLSFNCDIPDSFVANLEEAPAVVQPAPRRGKFRLFQ